jgi:lysine 2,3-aminomutase
MTLNARRHPQWHDWKWQLRTSVRTAEALRREVALTADEEEGLRLLEDGGLPLAITPYWMELMRGDGPGGPLRRQLVPSALEWTGATGERLDPLGEEELKAAPSLVHRYPDRVLLWVTDRCASYCRFCTRKRLVGQGPTPTESDVAEGLDYIGANPSIRDVVLSGGDSLLLDDEKLAALMARLRSFPHVEIIRVATRLPAFAPMRITSALVQALKPFQPVYFLVHFNHPAELTPEAAAALTRLADAGFPLMNQTVLLKGINDDVATLETLFRGLLRLRCKPYYLHHCDAIMGAGHFRTTMEHGMALMDGLRGRVSGLALPTYVLDVPGGKGKVPLARDPRVAGVRDDGLVHIRGSLGQVSDYPEPSES